MNENTSTKGLFDLSDDLLNWMKRVGATMHDAVRALRPGGPLDEKYLTQCCKCGVERVESLRWFFDHKFICECGGEYDVRGLNAFHFFVSRTLSLVREGASASDIAREKRKADIIHRKFFQPVQDVEH